MFTQDEKDKIREEILLREEIQQELSKRRINKFINFINSPFLITFIGGLFIVFLANHLQLKESLNKMELARWQTTQEKKYELIGTFCNDFESSIMTLASYRLRAIWLSENKDEKAKDKLGRSREQILSEYKELWIMYSKQRKPNTLFAQTKALFESKEVFDRVDILDKKIVALQKCKNEKEIRECNREIGEDFENLVKAMGAELRKSKI